MAGKPESSVRAPEIERDASRGRGARATTEAAGKLKVTQTKSTISHIARNRLTVKALGLRGIGSTSIVPDNPATRGMVRQVRFLVTVEEIPAETRRPSRADEPTPEKES